MTRVFRLGTFSSQLKTCLLTLCLTSGVLILVYLRNATRPVNLRNKEIKKELNRLPHSYFFHELFDLIPRNSLKDKNSTAHHLFLRMRLFNASSSKDEQAKITSKFSTFSMRNPTPSTFAKCLSPPLNPFDPELDHLTKTYPTIDCSAGMPSFTRVLGDKLTIDLDKVHAAGINASSILCRYRSHHMTPGQDFETTQSDWSIPFETSIKLEPNDEHLIVQCYKTDDKSLVAKSYLSVIRESMVFDGALRRQSSYRFSKSDSKKNLDLSVLMVGIDGMSRSQMIRTMPETRKLLEQYPGAFELTKHNKVGMNTFPNIIPLLTGLEVEEHTSWNTKKSMDSIPFIWKDFEKAGYKTQLVLDKKNVTPFHTSKLGWFKQPVMFYNRPTVVSSESDQTIRSIDENCIGNTPEVTHLTDYQLQLIRLCNNDTNRNTYGQTLPFFSFSFFVRLTHDENDKASAGDDLYLKFFQKLALQKLLNNTIVIFFSDHGPRFGPIRRTVTGMLEGNNPFCYILLPLWLLRKYPQIHSALSVNQNRLTTNFDLHQTLRDILSFPGAGQSSNRERGTASSSRGLSLFREIPQNRSCKKAGVDAVWCSCNRLSRLYKGSQLTTTVAQQFVSIISSFTTTNRSQCVRLKLKTILYSFSVYLDSRDHGRDSWDESLVRLLKIAVVTTPGNAVYEGLVQYSIGTNSSLVLGPIDRLNTFQKQAKCMAVPELRPFCFCRNLLYPRDDNSYIMNR